MRIKIIVALAFGLLTLTSLPAFAKSADDMQMATVDFFAAPVAMAGGGNYKIGDNDNGRQGLLMYGGKAGFKVGPLLLGGVYLEGTTSAQSSKESVSDSTRLKYPLPDHEKVQSIGLSAGLSFNRINFWLNLYPVETMQKDAIVAGNSFHHTYHGSGKSLEVSARVWNMIYLGAFYHLMEFNKYSSNNSLALADKETLDPKLTSAVYGISLSYLVPFSQIQKLIK